MEKRELSAQNYFNKVPKEWDSLYSHENWFMYIFNRLVRKGIFDRHELTFKYCGDVRGKSVLDIGCGTGRFSIEFAKRGASHVIGLDFAQSMVNFSNKYAQKMGVAGKCEFICDDFLTHKFDQKYDVVIAMGFFDYIDETGRLLGKIRNLTQEIFVASFPRPLFFRDIQRKIRYEFIKKVKIYSYTQNNLESLYKEAGFSNFNIIKIKAGYFVVARL